MKRRSPITLSSPAQYGHNFRHMIRFTTVAMLIACLPGCVLLDPTDPYASTSERFLNEDAPTSRSTTRLPDNPISLSKAIEIALANNPELAALHYGVDAARAEHDAAFGAILPTVGVKGGYDRYLERHRLGPPRYNGEHRTYSDGMFSSDVMVSIPLFAGGRLTSEIKVAELLQATSEHRLARNRQELVFHVSSMFYEILAQHHVIESLTFSRDALKEHLKRVTELLHAQKAAKVDQLRTEVRIADLEQNLVSQQNVLAIQKRILTNLMGIPQKEDAPAIDIATRELAIAGTTVDDVNTGMNRALVRRGDYLAARAALEAQAGRVDVARSAHWPSMILQGSYGGRWAIGNVENNGDDSHDDVGSVGIALDIPIFEGGEISARIRRARANLAAARERMRKLELQIRLDIETSLLNVSSSLQRFKATDKSIEQAKESLRVEREKYDLGKGAITDVLDAQSALLSSQMNYYRALADYNTALVQFRLATGETH